MLQSNYVDPRLRMITENLFVSMNKASIAALPDSVSVSTKIESSFSKFPAMQIDVSLDLYACQMLERRLGLFRKSNEQQDNLFSNLPVQFNNEIAMYMKTFNGTWDTMMMYPQCFSRMMSHRSHIEYLSSRMYNPSTGKQAALSELVPDEMVKLSQQPYLLYNSNKQSSSDDMDEKDSSSQTNANANATDANTAYMRFLFGKQTLPFSSTQSDVNNSKTSSSTSNSSSSYSSSSSSSSSLIWDLCS